MYIERYTDQYEDDVRRMVKDFQAESLDEYGMTFNDQALSNTINILKYNAFLLIIDGHAEGMLAGKEVRTPTSNEKFWHEVVWFVSKQHRRYGLKLLNSAKKVLKLQGFKAIVMVYMHNSKSDKLHRLYTRLGMQPMETNFIGRL